MNIIKKIVVAISIMHAKKSYKKACATLQSLANKITSEGGIPMFYDRFDGVSMACGLAISRGLVWGVTSNATVNIKAARKLLKNNAKNRTIAIVKHVAVDC